MGAENDITLDIGLDLDVDDAQKVADKIRKVYGGVLSSGGNKATKQIENIGKLKQAYDKLLTTYENLADAQEKYQSQMDSLGKATTKSSDFSKLAEEYQDFYEKFGERTKASEFRDREGVIKTLREEINNISKNSIGGLYEKDTGRIVSSAKYDEMVKSLNALEAAQKKALASFADMKLNATNAETEIDRLKTSLGDVLKISNPTTRSVQDFANALAEAEKTGRAADGSAIEGMFNKNGGLIRAETDELKRLKKQFAELQNLSLGGLNQQLESADAEVKQTYNDIQKAERVLVSRISELAKKDPNSASIFKPILESLSQIPGVSEDAKAALDQLNQSLASTGEHSKKTGEDIRQELVGAISEIGKKSIGIIGANLGRTTRQLTSKVTNIIESIPKKLKKASGELAKINKQVLKLVGSGIMKFMPSFVKNLGKGNGLLSKASSNLKNFILAGIGVRSIYFLFRKFWDMVKEGVKVLAQLDAETNRSLSNIMTAGNQLQNQFGALGGVILNAIAPAIIQLINLINKAIEAITRFFAALTGHGTYKRAIAVQKDYAASLGKTGKAAKDATHYLAAFDEINQMTSKDAGGSGGGSGSGITGGEFEDVPIDEEFRKQVESSDWSKIGETIANKLADQLEKIPWDTIQKAAEKMADRFSSLLNGIFSVTRLWKDIGATIGKGINTISAFANRFVSKTKWEWLGKDLAIALRESVNTIDWAGLGKLLTDKWQILMRTFHGFVTEWSKKDAITLGNDLAMMIKNAFYNIPWNTFIPDAVTFATRVLQTLTSAIKGVDWEGFVTTIANSVKRANWTTLYSAVTEAFNAIADIDWAYIGTEIGQSLNAMLSTMQWDKWIPTFVDFASSLLQGITNAISGINWDEIVQKIRTGIKNANWGKLLASTADLVSTFIKYGDELLSTLVDSLIEAVPEDGSEWQAFITSLSDSIGKAAEGIKDNWDKIKPYFEDLFKIAAEKASGPISEIIADVFSHSMRLGVQIMLKVIKKDWLQILGIAFVQSIPQIIAELVKLGFEKKLLPWLGGFLKGAAPKIGALFKAGFGKLKAADAMVGNGGFVDTAVIGQKLSGAFSTIGKAVSTGVSSIGTVLTTDVSALATTATGLLGTVAAAVGAAVAGFAIGQKISPWFEENIIAPIQKGFGKSQEEIDEDIAFTKEESQKSLGEFAADVGDAFWALLTDPDFGLPKFFSDLGQTISDGFDDMVTSLSNWAQGVQQWWQGVGQYWEGVGKNIATWFTNRVNDIKNFINNIKTHLTNIKTNLSQWWTGVQQFWTGVGQKIGSWFSSKIQAVINFKNSVVKGFQQLASGLSSIGTGIVNGLKKVINGFIGLLNKGIGALNKLSVDVPDAIPVIGGKHVGFNIPKIPQLAKGAVLPPNKPFMAMVGDQKQGTNVEAPLSTITDAVVQALSQMYNMTDNQSSDQPINIYIGDQLLDTVLVKSQKRMALRSGGR